MFLGRVKRRGVSGCEERSLEERGLEETMRRLMREELSELMREIKEMKGWREELKEWRKEIGEEVKKG